MARVSAEERIVIIGGGLAGLTAAVGLSSRYAVTVLDARPRLGGQILTEVHGGCVVERGAEGFVFRSEALPRLAGAVGLSDQLVGQSVTRSYGFDGERLRVLAPGEAATFLGFQVSRDDLGLGIRSFRGGMGSLVLALIAHLDGRVGLRTGMAADYIELRSAGVRVVLDDGGSLETDAVIVATPARVAASLLQHNFDPQASALLAAPVLSSVTVELAFARGAVDHPLDATGFVVAQDAQQDGLRACTFTSTKFADRSTSERVLLRLFFRPEAEQLEGSLAVNDEGWVGRATEGLRRVLRVTEEPLASWVSHWPDALPVFDDAHRAAVAQLETRLEGAPIELAGSAFHGPGIDAAVRSGERAAERLLARLA
ncbi:uncharacterized protein METZ01_LOCUS83008 [marine metagenome]|uniref:Amine oxidase domain-containing protein n=1 Tax=marine metagenome TaxID=408172 RepID=A0A381UQA4_9ZZZZ|tara:strand:+ start:204 stop:1313 length:1110 start_codon:yes stop_codon:yes gene_type:complete